MSLKESFYESRAYRRVWGHILIKKEFEASVSLRDEEEDELVFEDLGLLRHTDEASPQC